MKLLPPEKRKIAIIFTAGLGDALLLVPLLKALKKKQFIITGIFYSKYQNDCLFDTTLLDSKVYLNSKLSAFLYALSRPKYFANLYNNHLGSGKFINTAMSFISKRITTASKTNTGKRRKDFVPGFSDAEQNLYLLFSRSNAGIDNISNFYLPHPQLNPVLNRKFKKNKVAAYLVVQVSAGNNTTPYKNWPVANWLKLIEQLCTQHPAIDFMIVGDNTETSYSTAFNALGLNNCNILIGKTSVEEVFNLVAESDGYIGLDSGIMHMAVALQKKTVSIFGASNEKLYGYAALDNTNHKVISSNIGCRPCASWKNANTSRVNDPMQCPDFACLTLIEPDVVYQQVVTHFQL